MDHWAAFWKVACTVGFIGFYLLMAVVVPLGARDLFRLFRHLSRDEGGEPEGEHE